LILYLILFILEFVVLFLFIPKSIELSINFSSQKIILISTFDSCDKSAVVIVV